MKLYLAQHGDATPKDIDPERPLSEKGKTDVGRIATRLAQAGIEVKRVIHSGKLRARQSAEILVKSIALGIEPEISDQINPLDDPAAFDLLGACGGEDTMLVGHLPFMAKFAALLVTGDAEQALVAYQPGSIVCLESDADGSWQIGWMLRPELLD